jgi:hypothetical protein
MKFKTNAWYHLAATYDGEVVKIYVNGHVQKEYLALKIKDSPEPLCFGDILERRSNGFDGTVDELAVYHRALTADEVDAIYRIGASGKTFAEAKGK